MDQHLEDHTIFTLPTTLHQTPTHTHTLDPSTARHLATAIDPPLQNHSWRVVTPSDLTKSKSFIKLPEEIAELGVLVLHTLFSKIKALQLYTLSAERIYRAMIIPIFTYTAAKLRLVGQRHVGAK